MTDEPSQVAISHKNAVRAFITYVPPVPRAATMTYSVFRLSTYVYCTKSHNAAKQSRITNTRLNIAHKIVAVMNTIMGL